MDLTEYRDSEREQERTKDILALISGYGDNALDIGARDGYFSIYLAKYFSKVIALDLEKPEINHEKIECVKGDVTDLSFSDESFDLVFCAEVLEHIPVELLEKACKELARVTKKQLVIGVPYKQDIRVGRLHCQSCGRVNPPWGHVNVFDEQRLSQLFSTLVVRDISYVGKNNEVTNWLSSVLMDWAGNPFGYYDQEEVCIFCEKKLLYPPTRTILQKVLTRIAYFITKVQRFFFKPHHNWIHVLFEK